MPNLNLGTLGLDARRPLSPPLDEKGRRGIFVQLADVERFSEAAEVVLSPEAQALGERGFRGRGDGEGVGMHSLPLLSAPPRRRKLCPAPRLKHWVSAGSGAGGMVRELGFAQLADAERFCEAAEVALSPEAQALGELWL